VRNCFQINSSETYSSSENHETEMEESLKDLQFTLLSTPSTVMALHLHVLSDSTQEQPGKTTEIFDTWNLIL